MDIELPFPAKILWPNGRGHHMAKAREVRRHKLWAYHAAMSARWNHGPTATMLARLQWAVTVYPKPRGPLPDKDNTLAALKAYQDGIAEAMGLNDSLFDTPALQFAERTKHGKIVIRLIDRGAPCVRRVAA